MERNKKQLRQRRAELAALSTVELQKLLQSEVTQTDLYLIEKIFRERHEPMPKVLGRVTEDEVEQKVISFDALGTVSVKHEKSRTGMGLTEGLCVVFGVFVCLFLWPRSAWLGVGAGLVATGVIYAALRYAISFWKEMGRQ